MGLSNAESQVGERTQMTLPKKGARGAILSGIIDTGVHIREYKGEKKKPSREFIPVFTLLNDTYETDEGETRQCTVRMFPLKLMPGAKRGKYYDFYNAIDSNHEVLDAKGQGNVFDLIGRNCFVNIEYSDPDDEGFVYPNCNGISAFPEDFPAPEVEYNKLTFDLENPNRDVFEGLNSWVQDQIRSSEGYAGSELEAILEGDAPAPAQETDADEEEDADSPI